MNERERERAQQRRERRDTRGALHGLVFGVSEERTGALLTADAAIAATSVTVDDPFAFDEDGGKIQFGQSGEVVAYSAVNDTTGVLTVSALTAAHVTGDVVWAYPIANSRFAQVQAEGDEGDALQVVIPHHLWRRMPTGTYTEPVPVDYSRVPGSLDLVVRRVMGRGGVAPGPPLNVLTWESATDRVVVDWDAPPTVTDSSMPNYDALDYRVEVSTSPTFATTYLLDKVGRGTKRSYKVATGTTYYSRVWTIDVATGMLSVPIPAKLTANNDPAAAADGVGIGTGGGGGFVATWTKKGLCRVKHYDDARWTNTTGQTLTFAKARVTCGNREAGTGAPTGSALIFSVRRWPEDESSSAPIWTGEATDKLYINPGTYKDFNGPGTFDLTTLPPDYALTPKCIGVGSTFPGRNWTLQVFMEVS